MTHFNYIYVYISFWPYVYCLLLLRDCNNYNMVHFTALRAIKCPNWIKQLEQKWEKLAKDCYAKLSLCHSFYLANVFCHLVVLQLAVYPNSHITLCCNIKRSWKENSILHNTLITILTTYILISICTLSIHSRG